MLVHIRRSICGNASVQDVGNQMARSKATHHRAEHALRRQRVELAVRITDDEPTRMRGGAARRQVTSASLDGPIGVSLRKLTGTQLGGGREPSAATCVQ
jgi:hypothetical protein